MGSLSQQERDQLIAETYLAGKTISETALQFACGEMAVRGALKRRNIACRAARRRDKPLQERLWSNLEIGDEDECWNWTGATSSAGYGQVSVKGSQTRAVHRLVWLVTYGEIPEGLFVCHTCDNPTCANPKHLFLGTHHDNMRDMQEKGRHFSRTSPEKLARGEKSGACLHPELYWGERNAFSKLTDAQVIEIRERADRGEKRPDIARAFGVTRENVYSILSGKTWKHLLESREV